MKQKIKLWQLIGFATVSFLGTILHFLFDWLNKPTWIAPFSGVNESTWEHMKLLFWPMFIFAILQCFFFTEEKCYWCVKLKGTLIGLGLVPILFYTFNGVIGTSPDWINIAIFFVSVAFAYLYESHQLVTCAASCKNSHFAFFVLWFFAILFVVFTFKTPKLNIFKDPITNMYGI